MGKIHPRIPKLIRQPMHPARAVLMKPIVLSKSMKLILVGEMAKLAVFKRIALDSNMSQ